jgi:hypothetical protein
VEALLLSAKANMEVSAVAQTIQSVGLRHDSDVYIINNTESTCYGIIFAVEIICLIKNFNMRYNTIVEKDETNISKLISAAEQFSEERFLEGIKMKRYDVYDIKQTTIWVQEHQQMLNREYRALIKFSESFISNYATDNNKCFDTAYRLFNKIRSTISATSKIFKKMCPKIRKQQPVGVEKPLAIERSILSHAHYSPDLFGIETYDNCVKELYNGLETFFTTIIATLLLCREMINKEREVKKDYGLCNSIYKECYNKAMSSLKDFGSIFQGTEILPSCELQNRKNKAKKFSDFVCENYHKYDTQAFKIFILTEIVKNAQNEGLTEIEALLWPDNHSKAIEVRKVIKQFDDIPGIIGQKNKLSSHSIVEFIKWCKVEKSKEKKLYVEYFCENYKGRNELLGWTAINKERKDLAEIGISDEDLADGFEKALRSIKTSEYNDKSAMVVGF